ncbi:hypothetical protein ABZ863_32285 [Saccharomonospora sp. NPDC046836]|uniref:hypothetical protein n=1 Tax=Saccharomonospora sp. NPDC046836 TaxID=3156921 RepID=UPI0033C9DC62
MREHPPSTPDEAAFPSPVELGTQWRDAARRVADFVETLPMDTEPATLFLPAGSDRDR